MRWFLPHLDLDYRVGDVVTTKNGTVWRVVDVPAFMTSRYVKVESVVESAR